MFSPAEVDQHLAGFRLPLRLSTNITLTMHQRRVQVSRQVFPTFAELRAHLVDLTSWDVSIMLFSKERQDEMVRCLICQENIEVGDKAMELPCRHWFHEHCLGKWILNNDRNTCPTCRTVVALGFNMKVDGFDHPDGAYGINRVNRPSTPPRSPVSSRTRSSRPPSLVSSRTRSSRSSSNQP